MADVHLRGDLHRFKSSDTSAEGKSAPSSAANAISIGRCTVVGAGCVVKPPARISRGVLSYYPMKIGDNVFIGKSCLVCLKKFAQPKSRVQMSLMGEKKGPNSHISAASVSSHVYIGESCILEPFCIIRDNVKILPHSVVPSNMVIPSNSIVGGRPARVVGELGEGWGVAAGGGGVGSSGGAGGAATTGVGLPLGLGDVWVEGGDLRELVRSIK